MLSGHGNIKNVNIICHNHNKVKVGRVNEIQLIILILDENQLCGYWYYYCLCIVFYKLNL